MRIHSLAGLVLAALTGGQASSQVGGLSTAISVTTTATQAILQYSAPTGQACSLKAADMNRRITITNGVQSGGVVSITTRAPHGLISGSVVYLEGSGVDGWNGWQTIAAVPDAIHFSFFSGAAGSATTGNVGVLIDDLNPNLFTGADQDSRPGNPNNGQFRIFVVGKRSADVAVDGNRYTRALQADSRHLYALTCGTQGLDGDFTTQNLPLGDTHNEAPPVDRSRPGQYAYPTVQWMNRGQSLIDPLTGVRSTRAAVPAGTASTVQSFQTALDSSGAWKSPTGPLSSGGTATFTGPCQSGNCALLLRADSLSLSGGATYTTGYGVGSSLDWITVTMSNASINNAACSPRSVAGRRARLQTNATDCNIVVCLTVNGVTCTSAERDVALTSKPSSYTVGTGLPIDVWQDSGAPAIARPDVSSASGTVNYTEATRQVTWASGNKFSSKWTPGSWIMVGGAEYQIESIQSELALTLAAPGPAGDLKQAPYSGNNFGVLVRKKTAAADQVSIGYTTFQYGSSGMPAWPATSVGMCSPTAVTANGVSGYNCFNDVELLWVSADGTDVRDLGRVATGLKKDSSGNVILASDQSCGGSGYGNFDPLDGDTWFCLMPNYPFSDLRQGVVKVHYEGAHAASTPGRTIPDCGVNGGVQPCLLFTLMQPNKADAASVAGPAFNPEYLASGYQAGYFIWGGVSSEGDILIYTREASGQDSKGWNFVFTLGDRTPTGTGPNSMRIVAGASSYRHAPDSWCTIHSASPPEGGWEYLTHNDFSMKASTYVYTTALKSSLLNMVAGIPGGLNNCPANTFGAAGQTCTDITTTGEPTLVADGSYLQDVQLGDVIRADNEYMRVVAKADHTHLTLQRGYTGNEASHSGTSLYMNCGLVTKMWGKGGSGVWDFRSDPYGLNTDWTTILVDWNNTAGHGTSVPNGVHISASGMPLRIGEAACPSALLGGNSANCYQVRTGSLNGILTEPSLGVAIDPPFGGALGIGTPNTVDSHPGPCLGGSWCLDGRPMDGGTSDGVATMAGSSTAPFTSTTGQLWKLAGGASALKPKTLTTMAYVGRNPLMDVSGPGSSIPSDVTGVYQYCVALVAGECRADSAVNDIYVNAPLVSYGYCQYSGIAIQGDDTNSICIGPLGAYTGDLIQFGAQEDSKGAVARRLGPTYSRWNQQSVFWNMSMTTTGQVGFSQARWLDGVRNENLVTVLPPYPPSDSISRNTFVPMAVKIPPQAAGSEIVVEFGYAENGPADSFFCTSRQEACVAASSTVNEALPFYFAQSETYSGVPCASGCTVTMPALSQRVLYYRWKQRDASGGVTSVSETRATVTP